jgi:hypothetical protein
MADNRLLREAPGEVVAGDVAVTVPEGTKVPGVKEGTLNAIVQWIPIETIGLYVFLQELFVDPIVPAGGKELHEMDFSPRWLVFAIGLAVTVFSIPLYAALKQKQATASFRFPLGELLIGTLAFTLWAIALPDTPLDDWEWWNADFGVAALAVSAIFLDPLAQLFNIKAAWGKVPEPS